MKLSKKIVVGALMCATLVGTVKGYASGWDFDSSYADLIADVSEFVSVNTNLEYKGEDSGFCYSYLTIDSKVYEIPTIYTKYEDGYAIIGFAVPFGEYLCGVPDREYLGSILNAYVTGKDYKSEIINMGIKYSVLFANSQECDTTLVIPQAINNKAVKGIGHWCFFGMDCVDTVILPSRVEYFDSKVFCGLKEDVSILTVKGSATYNTFREWGYNVDSSGSVMGDVNNDGIVSSSDSMIALMASVGMGDIKDGYWQGDRNSYNVYLADVDNDGSVGAKDALKILRKAIGLDR